MVVEVYSIIMCCQFSQYGCVSFFFLVKTLVLKMVLWRVPQETIIVGFITVSGMVSN